MPRPIDKQTGNHPDHPTVHLSPTFDSSTSKKTDDSALADCLRLPRLSGRRSYYDALARLGRQAALALEYAHQSGVVHRDVKPGNLLLDARGQLWVTDFGLAQVTGDAGVTVTGEMLGTLRYASPEQVQARRGMVDHRSDIYSLGATLYELLTLRPIFEGRDRNELIRQIAEDDPPSPRRLVASVPRELETIVLKALRKEPSERYASAGDFAEDLKRFLDNDPIRARRPTLADCFRKRARQHPTAVTVGVVMLILLSAGSWVSTALVRGEQARTRAEQLKAEEAYQRERKRAEEAEAGLRLARRSVDELIQVGKEELADVPGLEGIRKQLLRTALAYYQEFVEQRRDDPDARAELLDTTRNVEQILDDLAVLRATSKLYLLCQQVVLEELQLNDEQRAKMKELTTRVGKQWLGSLYDVGRLPAAVRRRRVLRNARANEADVNTILTSAQQARLRQIGWQSDGSGAFRDPEVAAELKLSAAQRERIREIAEEERVAWMQWAWRGRPSPDKPSDNGSTLEKMLKLLTDEQRSRWREMTGKPLKLPLAPFGPPPQRHRGPENSSAKSQDE